MYRVERVKPGNYWVMQDVSVMISLPESALHTDLAVEQRDLRQRAAEQLMRIRIEGLLDLNPGIGFPALEGFMRDSLDTAAIQVLHHNVLPVFEPDDPPLGKGPVGLGMRSLPRKAPR
jgi:hypothetical protein